MDLKSTLTKHTTIWIKYFIITNKTSIAHLKQNYFTLQKIGTSQTKECEEYMSQCQIKVITFFITTITVPRAETPLKHTRSTGTKPFIQFPYFFEKFLNQHLPNNSLETKH